MKIVCIPASTAAPITIVRYTYLHNLRKFCREVDQHLFLINQMTSELLANMTGSSLYAHLTNPGCHLVEWPR